MRRCCLPILLVLLPLAARGQGAEYFPLSDGRTWHYDEEHVTGAAGFGVRRTGTATMRCGTARTVDGRRFYLLAIRDSLGLVTHTELAGHGMGGVIVHESSDRHLMLLPARFDGQRAQKATIKLNQTTIQLDEHLVGKPQKMRVPHGKHEAVPVSAQVRITGGVLIVTRVWYAKGIGPIKLVEQVTAAGVESKTTLVLRRVTGGQPVVSKKIVAERVEQPAGEGAAAVVGAVVAAGGDTSHASWKKLTALHAALEARARKLAARGLPALDGERKVCRGLRDDLGVSDKLIVSRGDLAVLRLSDCVVYVDGKITVNSYIKGCLIVCTGPIEVSGYIKDSVVVCLGKTSVSGYVKKSVVEAGKLHVGGYTRDNVLINTRPAEISRGDKTVESASGLAAVARGK